MKTLELLTLWSDWLSAADRLTRTLHEQTVALTLRDVRRVERLQPDLDKLMVEMLRLDETAVACTQRLAEQEGVEPNVRSLVRVLEKTEGMKLQETANRVLVTARNVNHLVSKNRKLIENEMVYINGTLTLIARTAEAGERPLARRQRTQAHAAVLIDQAA